MSLDSASYKRVKTLKDHGTVCVRVGVDLTPSPPPRKRSILAPKFHWTLFFLDVTTKLCANFGSQP